MSLRRRPVMGAFALAFVPTALGGQTLTGPIGHDRAPPPVLGQAVLTLERAVALALDSHPSVGEARAAEQVASGLLAQAKASRLPTLLTDASVARHQEPMLVAPEPTPISAIETWICTWGPGISTWARSA